MFTNHTCLHVSNLAKSVQWYTNTFAMKTVKQLETSKYNSVFVAFDSAGHPHAGKPLAQRDGVVELRKLKNSTAKVYDGNSEPYKGFGHLCVSVNNIAKAQQDFLTKGVDFKKKLEDGRQKNIAFVLDPDGYWIELIENALDKSSEVNPVAYRLNHTMIRVKDPKVSLKFYQDVLGMKLFSTRDFPAADFTLYFLGYEHDKSYVENKEDSLVQAARQSIVELTHNYGTESDASFKGYHVFDKDTDKAIGFDHIAVSIDDIESTIAKIGSGGNWITKFNQDPELKGTGLLTDPDGYKIQIQSFDAFQ